MQVFETLVILIQFLELPNTEIYVAGSNGRNYQFSSIVRSCE